MSLIANNFLYEAGVDWVKASQANPDRCLDAIWRVGHVAWKHHAGRFADGALDNPPFHFGATDLKPPARNVPRLGAAAGRTSRTLHVATTIYSVGGHTRVLAKWALRDTNTTPGIVLIHQTEPCPKFFEEIVAKAGGQIISLPISEPMMVRAAMLREISKQFDRVVLHTHPNDPVPVVAFAAAGGPPVVMFNHAHFSFCLGSTVSDAIINTMEYFRGITKNHRFPRRTAILTGTPGLTPLGSNPIDKAAARKALGIDESVPLAMSIAQENYFKPMEGYDFFRTASRLMESNPSVHLLIVGVPPESALISSELRNNSRFHCVGPVIDPIPYYRAADVCLESFPMPSLGAVIEAVAYGEAFPVPVYGPGECVLRVSMAPVLSYSYRPVDEDAYLAFVNSLLENRSETREKARQLRLSMIQYDEGWGGVVDELNRFIDGLKHAPGEIPEVPMNDCSDCQILARMNPAKLATALNILPYDRATRSQLSAAARGLINPLDAAGQIICRPLSAVARRVRGLMQRPEAATQKA
jgi:hypothetical protein